MYSIYIYIIYMYVCMLSTTTNIIIQSQKHCLDHLLQFYTCSLFFFFFLFPLPLLPLVFFQHEDKSLTQAFIETLFFLYQVNKQIITYQKGVGVPSFRQAFILFYFIYLLLLSFFFFFFVYQSDSIPLRKLRRTHPCSHG